MTIKIGEKLPDATFMAMSSGAPAPMKTEDVFAGKKVAVFALPGAFTPTCSARHLPGFLEKADQFKAKGVDTIACLSVNDVFVMDAWGKSQDVDDKILMLADGNGDFTRELGLIMDGRGFGMGERSQRYSMLVEDGVVTQLNVEEGGEFKVSAADYLLPQI